MGKKTKVLILGASGMLGSTLMRYFFEQKNIEVCGTARSFWAVQNLSEVLRARIRLDVNVEKADDLRNLLDEFRPDYVVNCIGIVKQLRAADDPLASIPINSLMPHRIAMICDGVGARLIHFSTDCVFAGTKGGAYKESDCPDATDLYGRTKLLGEVDYPNAITLRTSLIGHEINGNRSLVDWFLAQNGSTKGFRNAIFSGLPTIEIAKIIHQHIFPNRDLRGLYHVSAEPISKFELLNLISIVYNKAIAIIPDDHLVVDRSLDCSRFQQETGFSQKPWPDLVQAMHIYR